MTIQISDIKLLESAVMADVPEGGGAASGRPIADGVSNAVFPDIGELDRAGGRVGMRKVFAQVGSADTDTYFGCNVIVAEPPKDPRVNVTLFKANDAFDRRADAVSRMEAYLNKGPMAVGYLYENHIAGQRAIQLFMRPQEQEPRVGQVLVLVANEGLALEYEQYVRVTKVGAVQRTFTYSAGQDYQAKIVTCDLSDALRHNFAGSPASEFFKAAAGKTLLREALVADAGSYAGCVPLAQAASVGDFTIKAASMFVPLVPSAQTEVPMAAQLPYAALQAPVTAASAVVYTAAQNWTPALALALPSAALPGSISINLGAVVVTDDGTGILLAGGAQLGTVDYANGICTMNAGAMNGAKVVSYRPAGFALASPRSMETRVTIESRSMSYAGVIAPLPGAGTLAVHYMAQGRWYVLREAGGVIKGADSSYGAGTYNADSGAYIITLGALPDVGSSVIFVWGSGAEFLPLPVSHHLKAGQVFNLAHDPRRGAVSLSWPHESGVGTRAATVSAAGELSGDATGGLLGHELRFAPNKLPAANCPVTVNYAFSAAKALEFPSATLEAGGQISVLSAGAIAPGTLQIKLGVRVRVESVCSAEELAEFNAKEAPPAGWRFVYELADDGLGNIRLPRYASQGGGRFTSGAEVIGSVNYATGEIVFTPNAFTLSWYLPRFVYVPGQYVSWFNRAVSAEFLDLAPGAAGSVRLKYESGALEPAVGEVFAFAPTLALRQDALAQLVPGSVVLTGGGFAAPIGDNGMGGARVVNADGSVASAGSINYLTGELALAGWTAGADNAFSRVAASVSGGAVQSGVCVFRTAAAPLRPGSMMLQFATADGVETATADLDGIISTADISGTVDYETGIVRVRFGNTVLAAGNEGQPWYTADAVVGGHIFRPRLTALASLRYSCVAYSYLPLDAELLGIDPVRLPSDGRVPIFRAGGFVVLGHTGKITQTVSNGTVVNCGRVRLSRVRVVGADGVVITTGYSFDLEAGTVTFSAVAGYSQPVTVEHRIEDMVVVRDAQINGELSFTRPITHSYPVAAGGDPRTGTYVASALVAGDLFARVSLLFDQQSWNGTSWKDSVDGNPATATFNDAIFPLQVSNAGALTERWAVRFTSGTGFEVIGEHVGVVAVGNTASDCAPINPAAGQPYFSIPAGGWGSGWAVGNILRFNTVGAQIPLWAVRTVQQGPETVADDDFTLLIRGDVDTP